MFLILLSLLQVHSSTAISQAQCISPYLTCVPEGAAPTDNSKLRGLPFGLNKCCQPEIYGCHPEIKQCRPQCTSEKPCFQHAQDGNPIQCVAANAEKLCDAPGICLRDADCTGTHEGYANVFEQCGGRGYIGPIRCVNDLMKCVVQSEYFSQCRPICDLETPCYFVEEKTCHASLLDGQGRKYCPEAQFCTFAPTCKPI